MQNTSLAAVKEHKQKVCSLYKRAQRMLEAWYDRREVLAYYNTLMRDRFDQVQACSIQDGAKLVELGEEELFRLSHWHVKKFTSSPGGVAFEREVLPPDWVLDYWHPLEKAQYPKYFARREQRKLEYIKLWQKQYGSEK